jgi:hypothetical protein
MDNIVNFDTLLALLDDRDDEVYFAVRDRLIAAGPDILPVLEYALTSPANLLQHERLELIIAKLKILKLIDKTAQWANSEDKTLLDGWVLISSIQYPTILPDKIEQLIQRIYLDIWLEMNDSLTSIEKVAIINHIFYNLYHFELNLADLNAPENCLLNNLLVSRKGNQLSLATLYCILAKKLKLPIHPLNIGQFVILGYYEPEISKEVYGDNAHPYLFYINMEHKGSILGAKELDFVVHDFKEDASENVVPLSEGKHIKLLLTLLRDNYLSKGLTDKAAIANRLIDKLQKF